MHLSPQGHVETSAPLVLWLDRHVARTGGRSTHQLIARLRRQALLFHREALVLGGSVAYEHTASQWRELIRAAGQCSSARSSSLLVAAQSNAPDFGTAWLPIVRELRSMGNRSRCIEVRVSLKKTAKIPSQHRLSTGYSTTSPHISHHNRSKSPFSCCARRAHLFSKRSTPSSHRQKFEPHLKYVQRGTF